MLDITEVQFKKINKGEFLGYANVCISNSIVIKGIKLFNSERGKYIKMPGMRPKKQRKIRNFVFPINEESRIELLEAIVQKYEEETKEIED